MTERYVEYLRLDEIKTAPRNPKAHDEPGITRSIDDFGMGELPLMDERTGRLVAGHGRYITLRQLQGDGRKVPDGIRTDDDGMWLMPVIRGWKSRTDEHAEAYLVASNKLTEKGGWDDRQLLEILADLGDAQLVELTGFNATDVDNLEALLDVGAWDPPSGGARPSSSGGGGGDGGGSDFDEDQLSAVSDEDMWPQIAMRVPPEVFDAWRLLIERYDGKDDTARLSGLLRSEGLLP